MAPTEADGREAWREYLPRQRWFAGKGRPIASVALWESIRIAASPATFGYRLIEVAYRSGPPERYALGRSAVPGDDPLGAPPEAESTPARIRALLEAIAEGRGVDGEHGRLEFSLDAPDRSPRSDAVEDAAIVPVTGEQSNRSTRVGDRWMVKEYRLLQPGRNPDRELPQALVRAGFNRVPRPVGGAVYRRRGVEPIDLISVSEFVPNWGDGWTVWGKWLRETPPDRLESILGPEAERIGRLTGELHRTLARIFGPTPGLDGPTGTDLDRRRERWQERNDIAGHRLSQDGPRLRPDLAERIGRIEGWPQRLLPLARILPEVVRSGVLPLRIHGDYHLGQLLRADDGYWILDFEGEPAHPIAERRSVDYAAKDVAGMIRSIDYRLRAGDSGPAPGRPSAVVAALRPQLVERFRDGYLKEIGRGPVGIQPDSPAAFTALVRYYSIEKLCYELLYELDHRPEWLEIPLGALEDLLDRPGG
ncbi:MAG: phosphotransferase [Thermoplasmata archaeon]|jgi:maltokinase